MSDLGQVEDSDQEHVVDEGAGVDDQLLGGNVGSSPWDIEDCGCLCQRGRVVFRRAVLLDCASRTDDLLLLVESTAFPRKVICDGCGYVPWLSL